MDGFQSIFISRHPAETSVSGVLGTVPWQLVSRSQQVVLEDKQDVSAAEGVHAAALHGRCEAGTRFRRCCLVYTHIRALLYTQDRMP